MRTLPNMTILETGDATDVESVLDVAHEINGPVYIRMLRGEIPRLFKQSEPMRLNRARVLSNGSDITILSSGICSEEVMRASQVLRERGVSICHLHISTLKPFTDATVLDAASQARYGIITVENHTIIGGLGSAIAEVMAENGLAKKLIRLGLKDTYAHGAGRAYLLREYGIDAMAVVGAAAKLLGKPLNITENQLTAVRLEAVHSEAKAEAL
jgi:transketolase